MHTNDDSEPTEDRKAAGTVGLGPCSPTGSKRPTRRRTIRRRPPETVKPSRMVHVRSSTRFLGYFARMSGTSSDERRPVSTADRIWARADPWTALRSVNGVALFLSRW